MNNGNEIEQKFLLKNDLFKNCKVETVKTLIQSYFQENNLNYRIRLDLSDNKAIIAYKSKSELIDGALVRLEQETEVDFDTWKKIVLEKNEFLIKERSILSIDGFTYEIDHFLNLNSPYQNLILCEVEFESIDELKKFNHNPKPEWLWKNVSHLPEFENYNLFKFRKPFSFEGDLIGKPYKI